jgi:hypothetical protein
MPKSLAQFHQELQEDQYFQRMAIDPLAQFGAESQPLLGATILPEEMVQENSYEETQIRYRTTPAVDGTRYSPTQKSNSGVEVGSLKVDLGNTDRQDELTGQQHDALIKLLNRDGDAEAIAQAIQWVDKSLVRPHVLKNEMQRWQALALGSVVRQGVNDYNETVTYYQHPGHVITIAGGTVAAPAGWNDPNYDCFDDIAAAAQKLEDLGYAVSGVYSTGKPISLLQKNNEVAKRNSRVIVNATGQIQGNFGRVTMAQLNAIAQEDGLPAFTKYNAGWTTPTGFKRFLDVGTDADYMVFIGNTDRQWDMATNYTGRLSSTPTSTFADGNFEPVQNTLGYYAVGRNVGQAAAGRTVLTELQTRKPQGLFGESYQAGLPVILEPQAVVVLKIMRPTP